MASEWQRREIRLRDVRVSVLERRVGATSLGSPILLLHGLVAEGNTFRRLMRTLPADRRVIAMDLPGAGYSEIDSPCELGFHGMAEIVQGVAEAMSLEKPVLLGHSHGGVVALQVAQANPEWLKSLVLLCPAHPFSGRENALVSFYTSWAGWVFGHILPRLPNWFHLFVFRNMPGSRKEFTRWELAPYLHTLRKPGTVDHLLGLLDSWKTDMQRLRRAMIAAPLEVPTLLIWGDRDAIVPLSSADDLRSHLLHHKLVVLPGVGHLPNEESPEECGSIIQSWLAKLDTRVRQPA